MPCGNQVPERGITVWRLATSVSYVRADFTDFSMLFFQRTTHPTNSVYQSIMSHLPLVCPTISTGVFSVATTTVRPESPWRLSQTFVHRSNHAASTQSDIINIVSGQMTVQRSRFIARGGEEAPCYPFQYKLNVRTPWRGRNLANGWSNISIVGLPSPNDLGWELSR
ncbi:hypothetical protein BJV74DRAFT_392927 [Russula compacta]|nr:hypothetical protein BJV74DRAFT_392927 [Russula compacta]